MTYKSHNTLIQNGLKVNALTLSVLGNKKQKPLFVFDRGFARAHTSLTFSSQSTSPSSCVSVATWVLGTQRGLDDMDTGGYSNVLYHPQIPLNLYIYRDEETFKEPMYLISNVYQTLKSITAQT